MTIKIRILVEMAVKVLILIPGHETILHHGSIEPAFELNTLTFY